MKRSNIRAALAMSMSMSMSMLMCACGGAGDGGNNPDGGPPGCTMQIISVVPPAPTTGQTVSVNSQILKNNAPGIESYNWSVTRDATVVTFMPDTTDAREILFVADQAGLYEVTLMGTVGALSCGSDTQTVMASATGANIQTYRIRIVVGANVPAPVHEGVISVVGGTDNFLGPISIGQGVLATGTVRSPDSSVTGAYLRASNADEIIAEGFASADGSYALRMPFGSYDVLVVPAVAAPVVLPSVSAASLTDVNIPAADAVAGSVLDDSGSPIAGATVALTVDGVPSTLGVTDGAGDFDLEARAGSGVEVSVVPPNGTSRPSLVASVGAIGADSVVEAAYAPGLGARNFGLTLVGSDGLTPLPDSRVTFAARPIANAGTIRIDGGAAIAATGRARLTAVSNSVGAVASVSLPDALYDVFVQAPDGSGEVDAWLVVDLRSGQPSPSALSLETAATLTGAVVDDSGVGIADVDVSAVPAGAFSGGVIATTTAVSDASGGFSLTLSAGVDYYISYDAGSGSEHARVRRAATAPAPAAIVGLSDTVLPSAIRVTGDVLVSGLATAGAGANVTLFCDGCAGMDAIVPIADTIAGPTGEFALRVPDPGVDD